MMGWILMLSFLCKTIHMRVVLIAYFFRPI